jgi:hypothetical protein
MSDRISLITFHGGGFSSEPIDIGNLSELKKAMKDRGARTFQLCQIDYFGDWCRKGKNEPIAQLSEHHLNDLVEGKWDLSYRRD